MHNPRPQSKRYIAFNIENITIALYSSKYKEILNSPRQIMKEHEALEHQGKSRI